MTGSFCTYTKAFEQIDRLLEEGAILQTIFSDISQHIKCRYERSGICKKSTRYDRK